MTEPAPGMSSMSIDLRTISDEELHAEYQRPGNSAATRCTPKSAQGRRRG